MIPLAIGSNKKPSDNTIVLAADMGGTKVNLALCSFKNGKPQILTNAKFRSKDYASIYQVIEDFLHSHPTIQPTAICIGAAGPVSNNRVEFTNLSWVVDATEIANETGIKKVAIINDLEATAYGIAMLDDEDFCTLYKGNDNINGNIAIIAPGTGLGQAGMYFDGKCYSPFASEGGHCEFAPRTALDMELLQYLHTKKTIVSWEHVASGLGIYNIYSFLRDVKKMEEPQWLKEALQSGDKTAVISVAAQENKAAICVQTMQLFVQYLAQETTNLLLKLKATGGVFLGGGIPPKILSLLRQPAFLTIYMQSDRMEDLTNAAAVKVVLNDHAALLGAAYYALFGIDGE